jgi:hypothetical protein
MVWRNQVPSQWGTSRERRDWEIATTRRNFRTLARNITSNFHATTPLDLHPHAIMEDTIMLEASQGLFEEQSFTIIPNGLSDHDLDEVCDASEIHTSTTDAFDSYENKLPANMAL